VAFGEALEQDFKVYQEQVIKNAKVLSQTLQEEGFRIVSEEYKKDIDKTIFPGIQGGPLEHVIAAKAVAFGEALEQDFKVYQEQVIKNAKVLSQTLQEEG
ncbi:hypothetical protein EDM27_16380, partial [Staphylococcus aureus]